VTDRRTFIGIVAGGLVAVPFAARAQQPKMPVIGFVHLMSLGVRERDVLAAFHRGLSDTGYIEDRNGTQYLWAQGQMIGSRRWSPSWFAVGYP
jgi:putative ABC transport system substrate-binding protein